DGERVFGGLGVLDQDVEFGPFAVADEGGGGDVDAGVADRAGNVGQCTGTVFDVDDQVKCHAVLVRAPAYSVGGGGPRIDAGGRVGLAPAAAAAQTEADRERDPHQPDHRSDAAAPVAVAVAVAGQR